MRLPKYTYRYFSVLLALLVYFTSVGLVLGKRHCQLKQNNLLEGKQYSCAETGCQKGCCSTEFHYFKLDQDQQTTTLDFKLSKELIQFVVLYVSVFLENDLEKSEATLFAQYKPPLIQRDIPVLIQSFLL